MFVYFVFNMLFLCSSFALWIFVWVGVFFCLNVVFDKNNYVSLLFP